MKDLSFQNPVHFYNIHKDSKFKSWLVEERKFFCNNDNYQNWGIFLNLIFLFFFFKDTVIILRKFYADFVTSYEIAVYICKTIS